jgi:glycosyltransferase involved in cell wall biosynthesis
MHILMTADTVGGVWTYTRELVSGLLRRAHRVTLVSLGKLPCRSQISWMDGLPNLDYRPTPFALEWMQDSEDDIKMSLKYLENLVDEVKPDLLHLNQYAYGTLNVPVAKIVVAHSEVVSWWIAVHGQEPPVTEWSTWYRDLVTSGVSGADAVVAPSRWMMSAIETHYVRPATSTVIYNGRNPLLFDPNAEKHNRVISVGRIWDQAKQASLLTQQPHPVPVWIVGNQEHPEKLMNGYTAGTAIPNITFCGVQSEDEIRTLFAHAAIYAATSRYEPFGLAPVEAALSRCAVVANDIPSFREIWADVAYYFEANDPASLAAAIRTLAANNKLRQEYSDRAYERARNRFSANRMIDAYEQLYGAFVSQEAAA